MHISNSAPYIPLDSITSETATFESNNGSVNDSSGRHRQSAPTLDGSPTLLIPEGGGSGGSGSSCAHQHFDVSSESDGDSSGGAGKRGRKTVSFWVR